MFLHDPQLPGHGLAFQFEALVKATATDADTHLTSSKELAIFKSAFGPEAVQSGLPVSTHAAQSRVA